MSQLPEERKNSLNRAQAIKALWKKGILHWKLDSNQIEMRDMILNHEKSIIVIGASRQIGKSFVMCTLAVEFCLKHPNSIVKYIAPKVKDVRRIIAPLIREICSDAPEDLIPRYRTQEHTFRFPNGSEIQLAGTDNGHAESIRGTKSNLCIVDEAGFCDGLNYIINSVLLPTTTTTNGKIVMISTPSKSGDHDFMHFMKKAKLEGTFIKKTIYDNPRLKPEDIARLADAVGGVDSVDFKREYLVEVITDINDAVIPEFTKELQAEIVKEWPRPPYFDSYIAMDIGGRDNTAILFGYYDFRNSKLIIEDELIIRGNSVVTDTLSAEIKRKEEALWSTIGGGIKPIFMRIADNNNPILLNDLAVKHNLLFIAALKDDAEAALNNLRLLIKSKKVIINPRCITFIHELENTIWNKTRTSFLRTGGSHGDTIDAAKYLCRHLNLTKSPFPDGYDIGFNNEGFFGAPKAQATQFETKIKEIYTIKPRRFGRR